MSNRFVASFLAALALGGADALAADKTVELLTLEWPPYTASTLSGGGATTSIVRKAFEAAGYQVKVAFLPWKRAVEMVSEASNTPVAFFPGYHCKQKEGLVASEAVGDGPIGFAENVEAPLAWSSLDDLDGKRIGTVIGYSNTEEFDARAAEGRIKPEAAADDVTNLRKLANKRLDAVVIDKFVFEYMRKKDAGLAESRGKLAFNGKPLKTNTLFVCARGDAAGTQLIQDLNTGLRTLDINALTKDYFDKAL